MNKKKIYQIIPIALISIFLLIGCKNNGNNIEVMENDGNLPSLDRSSDIKCPDANQNGVRDDIEEYIIKNYSDEKQKKALFQEARAMQLAILANTDNTIEVKDAGVKLSRAITCVLYTFKKNNNAENPSVASNKIVSMTTNTKERLKAYLAFSKALDGSVLSSPEGDGCE